MQTIKHELCAASIVMLVIFLTTVPIGTAYSQSTTSTVGDAGYLVGHDKTAGDAVKEATYIVVCAFTNMGYPQIDASDELVFEQAEIRVTSVLKGSLPARIRLRYSVQSYPAAAREEPPAVGVQYVIFIKKLGVEENDITKIVLASSEAVASIRALVDNSGKK
jgi:hypothetical protein